MKNGVKFITVINGSNFISGLWDPHNYKEKGQGQFFSKYADIRKPFSQKTPSECLISQPIEYKHLARNQSLTFETKFQKKTSSEKLVCVEENKLLFGTMRAYLGNIAVTPKNQWLDSSYPVLYKVKSEFVVIEPFDGLTYFWWAFIQSTVFLQRLPLGGGGTRPRLNEKDLSAMLIEIPSESVRKMIHTEISKLAQTEWQNKKKLTEILNKHSLE